MNIFISSPKETKDILWWEDVGLITEDSNIKNVKQFK